jgi:tetratricopeptide (TPR) repeat protein
MLDGSNPGTNSNGKSPKWWLRTSTAICIAIAASALGCRSAHQYIDRGNQVFAAGKYDDAVLNYRNAIKKDPQSGEAQYRLALAMLKLKKPGEAYEALNRAVSLSPHNMPAKAELGTLCLAAYAQTPSHPAQLYNRAGSLAQELLKANPNSAEGLRLKGSIALIDNRPSEAVEDFQRALKASPRAVEIKIPLAEALYRNKQPVDGEREAKEAIAQHPDAVQAYNLLYSAYVSQERWADAEALLKLGAAKNPNDPTATVRLAVFYQSRQKPEDAERTINSLLERRAAVRQPDLLVGNFHALIHQWDKALADFQRGLANDPSNARVYQQRIAGVYALLGRRAEALKKLNEILAHDPKDLNARQLKLALLTAPGSGQNLKAAGDLAGELAKDAPSNAGTQLLAGQAFLAKGDAAAATARFQQASTLNPRSADPHIALARAALLRKDYPATLEQADAALALARDNQGAARLLRVMGLTGTGSLAQAKAEAQQLLHDAPNARDVQMQLGIIALNQKHYAEAQSYFQKLYHEGDRDLHPLMALVITLVAEKQPDRAVQLLESEMKHSPDSSGAEALLAATAEAIGKPDLALSEFHNLATKSPDSAEVQMRIAELERKKGNLQGALEAYQRAKQLAPNQPRIDAAIASVQYDIGQTREAIASYRKALTKAPKDVFILNNLAFALVEAGGDLNEALQFATTGLRQAPENPSLRDTVAWIDVKRGDAKAALPTLRTLTRKYPNEVSFQYHYGAALLKVGDPSAREQLQAALAKKPGKPLEGAIRSLLAQTH